MTENTCYCSICGKFFSKKDFAKHDCPELTEEKINQKMEQLIQITQNHLKNTQPVGS